MNHFIEIRKPSSGFSLVELMVAVVIGLIGTLVMFQLYATSEGQKRTTGSGGDSTQNGAIALYSIERDMRNAGHGLAALTLRAQPLYTWDSAAGVLPVRFFRPALITPGAGSDIIEINYATHSGLTVANGIQATWASNVVPIPNLPLVSSSGLGNGDHIAICQDPDINPLSVCVYAEITNVAPGSIVSIAAPPTAYINQNGVAQTARNNPPAGFQAALLGAVAADGFVLPANFVGTGLIPNAAAFNIGDLVSRIYTVQADHLTLTEAGVVNDFTDGIVAVRAQYGFDTNNDAAVDVWVNPRGVQPNPVASFTPNHANFLIGSNLQIGESWARVRAIRIAVVSRSGNLEKAVVESRASIPLWTNPAGNPTPAPSYTIPAGDGNRYRYQVFETIVPLRS